MAVRRGGGLFRIGSPYMSDLAKNGQEGEVLYFPPEPEGDCIVADNWGEYYYRDVDDKWASLDREGPFPQTCLLYTSPSPRDQRGSRMPSSA